MQALLGHRDWSSEVRQLSLVRRLEFLGDVACTSLDHWACADCLQLHPVVFPGITAMKSRQSHTCPRWPQYLPRKMSNQYQFLRSRKCHVDHEIPLYQPHYMQRSHAQLALKYARQPPHQLRKAHKRLLDRLLAPYYREDFCEEDGLGVRRHYRAQPKVKNGRFLLREERTYIPYIPTSPPLILRRINWDVIALGCSFLTVCPHLELLGLWKDDLPWNRRSLSRLGRGIGSAIRGGPGSKACVSCKHCSMDCEVCFEEDYLGQQSFVVRSWQDFGHEGSTLFKKFDFRPSSCHFEEIKEIDPTAYKPGGVRALFEDGQSPHPIVSRGGQGSITITHG
ncbi:hypothetical protein ACRALDRAFT_1074585 [Sodiomyces alcalophilus JCM 7366]|uniref:uncharacterized protein n=1 Tax=Sodiomyces alcalophilus JCM 7366 TaxID=591952 RepID=UPI0039B3FCE4